MNTLELAIYAAMISFAAGVLICPALIPLLRHLKFGQTERDDGPRSHLKKTGTPTMGGLGILASFLIGSLFFLKNNEEGIVVLLVTLGFGSIGFFDDFIKVVKKRSLGLKAYQKIILQLLVCGIFALYIKSSGLGSSVFVPFTDGVSVDLGIIYFPLLFIAVLGTVNGVNLTDGLDGLASGVTLLVTVFFTVIAWAAGSQTTVVAGAVAGSLLAFLLFNAYPARVFMGDTGSLALGGFVSALAFLLKMPLFIPIVGFIYFLEALSVILQVGYFKKTGRRIFKMAPIHHHFELSGWNETKVVATFYIITAMLCLVGFLGSKYMFN